MHGEPLGTIYLCKHYKWSAWSTNTTINATKHEGKPWRLHILSNRFHTSIVSPKFHYLGQGERMMVLQILTSLLCLASLASLPPPTPPQIPHPRPDFVKDSLFSHEVASSEYKCDLHCVMDLVQDWLTQNSRPNYFYFHCWINEFSEFLVWSVETPRFNAILSTLRRCCNPATIYKYKGLGITCTSIGTGLLVPRGYRGYLWPQSLQSPLMWPKFFAAPPSQSNDISPHGSKV